MTLQTPVYVSTAPDDGQGDKLRDAFIKINERFKDVEDGQAAGISEIYQGARAVDPTVRGDLTPLQEGDFYFNTALSTPAFKVYIDDAWVVAPDITAAALAAATGSSLVGFQQAGTGAVPRTVQNELRDFVSVKQFGAVGDGVTDDLAAIQAAIDYAHANGLNVAYPPTNAFYRVSRAIICRPYVSQFGLNGYAKIKNLNTDPSAMTNRAVFLAGNLGVEFVHSLTVYNCGTVSVGSQVTLTTPADAANFAVGDQVVTASTAFSTVLDWKLYDHMHLNRVVAINGATITLKYPVDTSYAGGIAKLAQVTTSTQPYNIPLFFAENAVFSNLDLESGSGGVFSGYNACYNVHFKDCIMKGRHAMFGNCYQYCTFDNIQSYWSDKLGEFAQNSIHSSVTNSRFTYFANAALVADPILALQIGENSRNCNFTGNTVDVGNIAVTPGYSLFQLLAAQDCQVFGNMILGSNPASQITVASFAGNTVRFRCLGNKVTGNTVKLNGIRLFAYFSMVDSSNTDNSFDDNLLYANSGALPYSVRFDNSYGNFVRGNKSNFGSIYFNDTASSGNLIEGNFFPLGFGAAETSLSNDYYQNNTLRNNESNKSRIKRKIFTKTAANITAAAGVTTTVFDKNVGTSMSLRDEYLFEFFAIPTGNANTKPMTFVLRNNTDATNQTIFSHTTPAGSVGYVLVRSKVLTKGEGSGLQVFTTVYDQTTNTTSTYINSFTRPASSKDLSFVLEATPGASTSLIFLQLDTEYSNPYE
jgi:hypothetical protein